MPLVGGDFPPAGPGFDTVDPADFPVPDAARRCATSRDTARFPA
ncbi:MAG: hypothetical protein ACRDTE_16600 [Pseudonocardiaceae bacterium]